MSLFFKRRAESQYGNKREKESPSPFNRHSEKRHSEFFRVQSPSSRTLSFLAEGYTEDGQLSKYENMRAPSRLSVGSTLNSKNQRLSLADITNAIEQATEINQMLNQLHHGDYTTRRPSIWDESPKPKSLLGRLKYYYDKYNLRNYVPVILLLIYSILGAFLFYLIEHDHEQELKQKRHRRFDPTGS